MKHSYITLLLGLVLLCIACSPQQQGAQTFEEGYAATLKRQFIYEKASFPSCHASTIVETAGGTLLAAWFGGTDEGEKDVAIWISSWENTGWSAPEEVVNGVLSDTLRHPCWNPVLFQPTNGPVMLYYKTGPSPREWWGMVMQSEDEGHSWTAPERLADSLLGPVRNKAIELDGGVILFPSSTEHAGWRVHMERSTDKGKTWQWIGPLNDPDEFAAIQPTLLTYADGRIQMLCRSKQGVVTTSWSEDKGTTWSPMTATDLPNNNSGIDGVTLQDGRQLLVYNPTQPPPGKWGGPRSPLVVAISEDGINWEQIAMLENEKDAEFSYPAVIQAADGKVHITYTWKRERIRHVIMEL